MLLEERLNVADIVSSARYALNGFCDLLTMARDDQMNEVKAQALYFLIEPIQDKLERACVLLDPDKF